MRRFLLPLALFAASVPCIAHAHGDEAPASMSADEAVAVQEALNRGLDLYRYDQAAWHTTDALMEDIADPSAAGIRGWVVVPVEKGWLVTYWRADGEGYAGVYSALWDGAKVRDGRKFAQEDSELSDQQIALIEAGGAVDPRSLAGCANAPFNSVIMPSGKASGSILVYLLTPQSSLDSVPLGGHYRFEVLDGKVVDQREFTKSCLTLSLESKDGAELQALGVSHLLDPVPTEIHVFSALAAKMPIFVITPESDAVWAVENPGGVPKIRLVNRD